jgi:sigma-E factor negative regulatory protein RseA
MVMSDTKRFDKEILSAWVDGSVSDSEREHSLEQGSESMATWSRYHMIGQVMREEVQHMDLDISAKVSQAVAQEASHSVSTEVEQSNSNVIPFPNRIWKQAGGFAIAASVALVALFSISNTQPTANQTMTLADTNSSTGAAIENASLNSEPLNSTSAVASNAERQELQTMHDMFLKHEALTRKITGMSSLPSVRVVSNQKVIPVQVPMRVQEDSQQATESTDQE